MIYTRCIFSQDEGRDGIRISVMSRHTLNDGLTPDPRITMYSYNLWMQELAPPTKLVGDYYKRGLPWEKFSEEYQKFLKEPGMATRVKALAKLGLEKTVTLLCAEETADKCHRRLLAEECQRYEPSLKVEHKDSETIKNASE